MRFQLNVWQHLLIVVPVEDSALMACEEYEDIAEK